MNVRRIGKSGMPPDLSRLGPDSRRLRREQARRSCQLACGHSHKSANLPATGSSVQQSCSTSSPGLDLWSRVGDDQGSRGLAALRTTPIEACARSRLRYLKSKRRASRPMPFIEVWGAFERICSASDRWKL